jgi:hypothetical protein
LGVTLSGSTFALIDSFLSFSSRGLPIGKPKNPIAVLQLGPVATSESRLVDMGEDGILSPPIWRSAMNMSDCCDKDCPCCAKEKDKGK